MVREAVRAALLRHTVPDIALVAIEHVGRRLAACGCDLVRAARRWVGKGARCGTAPAAVVGLLLALKRLAPALELLLLALEPRCVVHAPAVFFDFAQFFDDILPLPQFFELGVARALALLQHAEESPHGAAQRLHALQCAIAAPAKRAARARRAAAAIGSVGVAVVLLAGAMCLVARKEAARRTSQAQSKEQLALARQLFNSAARLFTDGDYEAAKLGFERGLAIDPGNGAGQFLMAETLARLKDTAGARERYTLAVALAPNSPEGLRAEAALKKLPVPQNTVIAGGGDAPTKRADHWDCAECPEMMIIPAGSYTMGSPANEQGRTSFEGPQHQVNIGYSFAASKFEITFGEWDACKAAGGCQHHPSDQGWGRGNRPVINVSWQDAKQYVAWLSAKTGRPYRLLSDAEWEYAARGSTTTAYYWGDAVGSGNANCDGCGSAWDNKQSAPVGSFAANAFGLHDMLGNVREWTEDCWNAFYKDAPSNGSAWMKGNCDGRVFRGGSWFYTSWFMRSAYRNRHPHDARNVNLGFRVARTLP